MKYTAHEFMYAYMAMEPKSYTDAYTTGDIFDTQGYSEALFVLQAGVVATSGELDCYILEAAATGDSFAHISGSSFTQITPSNDQDVYVGRMNLHPRKRYIRPVFKTDGSNAAIAGLGIIFLPVELPAVQDNTTVFSIEE